MKHTIGGIAVVALLLGGLAGCGDSGGGDEEPMDGEPCVTGVVYDCVGPGGREAGLARQRVTAEEA